LARKLLVERDRRGRQLSFAVGELELERLDSTRFSRKQLVPALQPPDLVFEGAYLRERCDQ
jgi:hypothetical protein